MIYFSYEYSNRSVRRRNLSAWTGEEATDMQRIRRRGLGIVLAAAILLAACGASLADAQQDAATNMELPVGSFAELRREAPDVPLMDAPKGAEDVAYSVVGNEPSIAQIKFVLYGRSFCYRAARFNNSASMPDISGMKNAFDAQMELGGVLYRQDTKTGAGVASWYYESTRSQYTVAIQRSFDAEYMRKVVVAMRSQNSEPVKPDNPVGPTAETLGTVTGVSSEKITIKDIKSGKYAFSIDETTVYARAAGLYKNDIVRITYTAPYAENRLAKKIELVEPVKKSGGSTAASSRATRSGTILSRGEERLQILRPSGSIYTFYTAGAAIYGDLWAGEGDSATVTYYVNDHGTKVATKITYTAAYCPAPVPAPWSPAPEPWPGPVPNPNPYNPLPQQPVW